MSKKTSTKTTKPKGTEITYVTKQVDTSVVLLDSPEDDAVLEALMYLSQYADIQENNLNYIQRFGLLQRLLNLLKRNAPILRVTLKLLGASLKIEEVMQELNQEIYDDKIIELSKMFISHNDLYVQQCCVLMISQLTASPRILGLIFDIALFAPTLRIIEKTEDLDLHQSTLELLSRLVDGLSTLEYIPDSFHLDVSILMNLLNSKEKKTVDLGYEMIQTLTSYNFDGFQKMFKKEKLIEIMLTTIMNGSKQKYHELAIDVIFNSMDSPETSDYFIETLEFLEFCQWVKTCGDQYLLPFIVILEQLTRIPSRKQILFDLSVEQSILSFFRSKDEEVLNKTCEAISNMVVHRYCCEELLKPSLLKHLFDILASKEEEKAGNEVALTTILDFNSLSLNTLGMIHAVGGHKVLLRYFNKGIGFISEEGFLQILELMLKMSICPQFQRDMAVSSFFEKLLDLFQTASATTAYCACQIMINFMNNSDFRNVFLQLNGPHTFLERVRDPKDLKLMKIVLIFIYNSLVHDNVIDGFLGCDLVDVIKGIPEYLKETTVPIADKVLRLVYNRYLPLKFFETNRLDITDKIQNKFYLISGQWNAPFPVFKGLEDCPISPAYAIYVVDYSFEMKSDEENTVSSESMSPKSETSQRTLSTLTRVSSSLSSYFRRGTVPVNYGKPTLDPFLPMYICHVTKYLAKTISIDEKVRILAKYIDAIVCEPVCGYNKLEKVHHLKLHVEILKHKMSSNLIPVGFLRLGGLCERALLFKAISDKCSIPVSLVKGTGNFYWNEILLLGLPPNIDKFRLCVVDLINNVGDLLVVGSRAANQYCNMVAWNG